MKKYVTEEQKQQMVALYQDGLSMRAIAAMIGCSETTVSVYVRSRMNTRKKTGKFTFLEMASIVQRYNGGESSVCIASDVGCTPKAVCDILRLHQVTVKDGGRACYRKHQFNQHFFDHINTEAKAYWLGFITADGNLSKRGHAICIGLAAIDEAHLRKFCADIGYAGPISHEYSKKNGKSYPRVSVRVSSKKMHEALQALGLYPNKSLTVRPCPCIPTHLLRHYWRGVFDGDGSIHISAINRHAASLVGSEWICRGFELFCKEHVQTVAATRPVTTKNHYVFAVGGLHKVRGLLAVIYGGAEIYLNRKMELHKKLMSIESHRDIAASLNAEMIHSLLAEHGTWTAVAAVLGITEETLSSARKRLGMPIACDYDFTFDELNNYYATHGSWRRVASALGVSRSTISKRLSKWRAA